MEVGEKRRFHFDKREFKIVEILHKPEVSMWWTWDTGLCPHCKKRITRKIKHDFISIEALIPVDQDSKSVQTKDIMLLGQTTDNRNMLLSEDKYDEVLGKTKELKKLVKEVK